MARPGKIATLDVFVTLGEWVTKIWPVIFAFFGGGGMTYLASLNPLLSPLEWGLIGAATFMALYLGLMGGVALWSWAAAKRGIARLAVGMADTATVNPLDMFFEKKRIDLRDFDHPVFQIHKNTTFTDCEIFGGGMAFYGAPHLTHINVTQCNIVVVKEGTEATVPIFDSPRFIRCRLYRVTFYLTARDARGVVEQVPWFPVISDGTCGEF